MRIGINLLFLLPGEVGGTQTYSFSLLDALGRVDKDNEYFLLINRETAGCPLDFGANFQTVVCPFRAANRLGRFLWEQFLLPFYAWRYRLDLLHSLGYTSPFFLPCKSVVTIHDLNFLAIPEAFTWFTRKVQAFFVRGSARRADAIIVVSEFVRQKLAGLLSIPLETITAIHEAPKTSSGTRDDAVVWNEIQEKYSVRQPYIVAFSSLAPHKNIPAVIRAYARIRKDQPCQLVIAGHLPKTGPDLPTVARELGCSSAEVVFTGYVTDEQAAILLKHALVLAFPSLYEGFGLPPLEAMQAGTPVICSNLASLPEVGGDAPLYFDPKDDGALESVLSNVVWDEALRRQMVERGFANLARFSWDSTAQRTLDVYTRCFRTEPERENSLQGKPS